MKVMTIVGTRPEIIRLSRVVARLEATEGVEHVLVHTGQNYDHGLNQVFFDDLALRAPDHYLGVDTSSLGAVLGGVLIGTERVLLAEQPDAVLVLGDTNSCLATVMAKRYFGRYKEPKRRVTLTTRFMPEVELGDRATFNVASPRRIGQAFDARVLGIAHDLMSFRTELDLLEV